MLPAAPAFSDTSSSANRKPPRKRKIKGEASQAKRAVGSDKKSKQIKLAKDFGATALHFSSRYLQAESCAASCVERTFPPSARAYSSTSMERATSRSEPNETPVAPV